MMLQASPARHSELVRVMPLSFYIRIVLVSRIEVWMIPFHLECQNNSLYTISVGKCHYKPRQPFSGLQQCLVNIKYDIFETVIDCTCFRLKLKACELNIIGGYLGSTSQK